MSDRRVVSWARGAAVTAPALALHVDLDEQVEIGREGDLPVGVEPEDPGISRLALSVTARATGWELRSTNRNGAVLHRWGQAPTMLEFDRPAHVRWPRAGVRLLGKEPGVEHWVLFEADDYLLPAPEDLATTNAATYIPSAPRPLTSAQRDALTIVFAEHLAWPPVTSPVALARETAGRKLGISYAGVVDRLTAAQRKAHQLGSPQQVGLMEPDYLYVLVARGYLDAPTARVEADDLD